MCDAYVAFSTLVFNIIFIVLSLY